MSIRFAGPILLPVEMPSYDQPVRTNRRAHRLLTGLGKLPAPLRVSHSSTALLLVCICIYHGKVLPMCLDQSVTHVPERSSMTSGY